MAKRPSLTSPIAPLPSAPAIVEPTKGKKPSYRDGKRPVMFWLDAADYEELQVGTARLKTTIQKTGEQWFADWCQKNAIKRTGS